MPRRLCNWNRGHKRRLTRRTSNLRSSRTGPFSTLAFPSKPWDSSSDSWILNFTSGKSTHWPSMNITWIERESLGHTFEDTCMAHLWKEKTSFFSKKKSEKTNKRSVVRFCRYKSCISRGLSCRHDSMENIIQSKVANIRSFGKAPARKTSLKKGEELTKKLERRCSLVVTLSLLIRPRWQKNKLTIAFEKQKEKVTPTVSRN